MTTKVQTLEESLKESKALAAMYQGLITRGVDREQMISEEIAKLQDTLGFLQRARQDAPASLKRAEESVRQLELQKNANLAVGYSGPSKATLQRKADRVDSLKDKLRDMARKLRAAGLDPEALLRGEVG